MFWRLRACWARLGRSVWQAGAQSAVVARRLSVTALLAALVGGLMVAAPSPTMAATGEVYLPPPPDRTWSVQGHGVGPGLGLSEYGARNRALSGHGTKQILDFYYPGTVVDHLADGATVQTELRALATAKSWSIAGSADLVVRDEATGVETPLADPGARYRVTGTSGHYQVDASTDQGVSWTPVVLADNSTVATGPMRLSGPALLHLHLVVTNGAYRPAAVDYEGALIVWQASSYVVNEVSLDAYTASVLGRIGHTDWPAASLRAMAVAVRSLAADAVAQRVIPWDRCNVYDGGPIDYCENYNGRYHYAADGQRTDWEPEPVLQAVRDTAGEIRSYASAPIFARFGESNGGWTVADGRHPYLVATPDPFDAAGNPSATWNISVDPYTMTSCLNFSGYLGTLRRIVVTRRDGHGEWGGRVTQMRLEGVADGMPTQLTIGSGWWQRCGLPSANFTITSGFALRSAPAGVSTAVGVNGMQDLFALGPFDDIQYRRNPGDWFGWRDWASLGGAAKGSPSALRMLDGSARVFVQGTNDALYVGVVDAQGGWHGWRKLGGSVASRPYPALLPDGSIYLFYRAKDRTAGYLALKPNGSSAGFHPLGGVLATDSAPAAAAVGPGQVTVAIKGVNGNVYTRSLAGGRWAANWVNLGGRAYGDLAAASPSSGVFEVYLRGGSPYPLYARRAVNGRWGGWVNLGGQLTTGPFAFSLYGTTTLWAGGLDGVAYERDQDYGHWGPWHAAR